jgi:hypothetical protein
MDFEITDDSKTITDYEERYSIIIKIIVLLSNCKSNARRKEKRHSLLDRPLKFQPVSMKKD